jgi:PIN domain nuclease of toxin-antitoxin system
MRTLLDTHAWIWLVSEDRRLSKRATVAIATALAEQDLWLSLTSVWEVARKVEKQQLVLDRPVEQWLDEDQRSTDPSVCPCPLDLVANNPQS